MKDIRLEKLAKNLIQHSINLQKSEKILIEIIGTDAILLGKELIKQAKLVGGIPIFNIIDKKILKEMIKDSTKEQIEFFAR